MLRRLTVSLLFVAVVASGCNSRTELRGIDELPDINLMSTPVNEVGATSASQPLTLAAATPEQMMVVYMGYTNCPDICPTTMSDLRQARESLGTDADRIKFAFVTVDLAFDQPAVLLDYTKRFDFGAGDHTVRPTPDQLTALQKKLFAASSAGAKAANGTQLVNHSAYCYVVDHTGKVRVEWSYGTTSKDMAHDMKTLLTPT